MLWKKCLEDLNWSESQQICDTFHRWSGQSQKHKNFMSVLSSTVKLVTLENILQFAYFPTCEYIGHSTCGVAGARTYISLSQQNIYGAALSNSVEASQTQYNTEATSTSRDWLDKIFNTNSKLTWCKRYLPKGMKLSNHAYLVCIFSQGRRLVTSSHCWFRTFLQGQHSSTFMTFSGKGCWVHA